MALVYFVRCDECGGRPIARYEVTWQGIPARVIDQNFPDRARAIDAPSWIEAGGPFDSVVVRIFASEVAGRFDAPGHWLLEGVETDEFIATFERYYTGSITRADIHRLRSGRPRAVQGSELT